MSRPGSVAACDGHRCAGGRGRLTTQPKPGADDDSGNGLASRVAFDASRGVTYRIAVDSFGAAEGNYLLKVIC